MAESISRHTECGFSDGSACGAGLASSVAKAMEDKREADR